MIYFTMVLSDPFYGFLNNTIGGIEGQTRKKEKKKRIR